jgi:SAM-dependent methyltransferase
VSQPFEQLGVDYTRKRQPDPRIAAALLRALGDADSVVNVGAGAGAYEPRDRRVIAVEPARTMIRQRPPGSAPVVRAVAGALPFADRAFAAALAVLTIHHWPDVTAGLAECRRVARDRVVILTWDPDAPPFWLHDYVPALWAHDRAIFPPLGALGARAVAPVPIPHDCVDGFLGAYWRRPEAYLDPAVRFAMSTFSRIDAAAGIARLARDLADGTWAARHGDLLALTELDVGYRVITL